MDINDDQYNHLLDQILAHYGGDPGLSGVPPRYPLSVRFTPFLGYQTFKLKKIIFWKKWLFDLSFGLPGAVQIKYVVSKCVSPNPTSTQSLKPFGGPYMNFDLFDMEWSFVHVASQMCNTQCVFHHFMNHQYRTTSMVLNAVKICDKFF